MKHLHGQHERARRHFLDARDFSDGTSFPTIGPRGHERRTRRLAGDAPGPTLRTSRHNHCVSRVVRRFPARTGHATGLTEDIPGVMDRAPGIAVSPHDGKLCAPDVRRCAPGVKRGASGAGRCVYSNNLCHFRLFASFPFGAVKQNTEKPAMTKINKQKHIK